MIRRRVPPLFTTWAEVRAELNELFGTLGCAWWCGFMTALAVDTFVLWSVLP